MRADDLTARPAPVVVVRLPNWLGDLLMARPALSRLRASGAMLHGVLPASLLPLARWEPGWSGLAVWPDDRPGRAALATTLRALAPDAVLVLPPSLRSARFARATGARIRVGWSSETRAAWLTHAVPRPARGAMHLAEEYQELVAELEQALAQGGATVPGQDHAADTATSRLETRVGAREHGAAPLAVSEHARDAAAVRRAQLGIGSDYAVLGPGATYGPAKRWDPARFAAVGRALLARGVAVLACGAAGDRAACRSVVAAIGAGAHSLAGATDLAEQAALCAGARFALCNDSGLAHLAAATGTPTVVVFGSTSSAWTAPLGPRVRIVQHAPVCSPCFQRTCAIGYRCLDAVRADEVLAACLGIAA